MGNDTPTTLKAEVIRLAKAVGRLQDAVERAEKRQGVTS